MALLPFFLQISFLFPPPSGPWITLTATLPSLNLTENLEGEETEKPKLVPLSSVPASCLLSLEQTHHTPTYLMTQDLRELSASSPAVRQEGGGGDPDNTETNPRALSASLSECTSFPVTMTRILVTCPELPLLLLSWPYFSVTVTESCLCVASNTAWYIFVSSSTTWSLTSRMSPLETDDDILGKGGGRLIEINAPQKPEGRQRPIVRNLVLAYPAHLSPKMPTPETPPRRLKYLTQMQAKEPILEAGD